jgi:ribosomal-protein-alanine N-acetyltransferase
MEKDKFIDLGEIYLRSLTERDLQGSWYKWFNDAEVTKFQNKGIFPNTFEKQKEYYEHLKKSHDDIVLAIIHDKDDLHIGNIGLHKIDYIHRHADVGIILGERKYQNRGYATQCIEAIKDYSFKTLNLHRLTVYIMKDNIASYKAFLKAGFKKEGIMSELFYKNGKYVDVIVVGCVGA